MEHDGTGWARRALTAADRAEIGATPAPAGTSVYFFGLVPPLPALNGRPAQAGLYSASITLYPRKWHAKASTPIAAFRLALAAFREEEAA